MKWRFIFTLGGGLFLGLSNCVLPDKGIVIISDCGHLWCATATNAYAMKDGFLDPFQVLEGDPLNFVTRCLCINEEQQCTLLNGDPDDPSYVVQQEKLRNAAAEGCIEVAKDNDLDPDAPLPAGFMDCVEAAAVGPVFNGNTTCTLKALACSAEDFVCSDPGTPTTSDGTSDTSDGTSSATASATGSSDTPEAFEAKQPVSLEPWIDCDGNECTISQSLIDFALSTPEFFLEDTTRLKQKKKGKSVVGMHFTGIKTGSLADLLGFQNGDIVTSVAGLPFTSEEDFLAVGDAVLHADLVIVVTQRDGKVTQRSFIRE